MYTVKWWHIVLYGFLCLQTSDVLAGLERRCTSATYERGPQGVYCGTTLSDSLKAICGSLFTRKRGTLIWNNGKHWYRKVKTEDTENKILGTRIRDHLGHILVRRKDAATYLDKRSINYDQGIVCECCYHLCIDSELSQYCGSASTEPPPSYHIGKRSILGQEFEKEKMNTLL